MSDSGQGNVALNSDMYFTCSSGLAPAKMYPTQNNHGTKEKFYYLTHDGKATQQAGDFFCRWTVALAAAIAAAGILTGGAALAVLVVVAIAASAAMCGGLAAPFRKWVGYSTLNAYGKKSTYSLTSKCSMICPIGGIVTYAPGITGTWSALAYTARNTAWAALEGALVGRLGALGFGAFAGVATPAMSTALLNFAALNVAARGIGTLDQVFVEGMLRNGKNFSQTKDEAISGATMFEQPFINIGKRINSGYYNGGYTEYQVQDEKGDYLADKNGKPVTVRRNEDIASISIGEVPIMEHGSSALATDVYYAGLSVVSFGLMAKGAVSHENIIKESAAAAQKKITEIAKATGKKFLFERTATKTIEQITLEADEACIRAIQELENLGENSKTVASDGMKSISGWKEKPEGFIKTTPEEVKVYSDEIGHTPTKAGAMDQLNRGGFDGKYNCSHAEKQILTKSPNEPIGVSRKMCKDCQSFASKQAQATGKAVAVSDPSATRIFLPDGSRKIIPKD